MFYKKNCNRKELINIYDKNKWKKIDSKEELISKCKIQKKRKEKKKRNVVEYEIRGKNTRLVKNGLKLFKLLYFSSSF